MSLQQKAFIAKSGQHVHVFSAETIEGKHAWYFIYTTPRQYNALKRTLASQKITDLGEYGTIIASCYGKEPTQEVLELLKTDYNFDWKPE